VTLISEFPEGLFLARHTHYPKYKLDDFKGNLDEMIIDVPWDSDTAPGQGRDIPRYKKEDFVIPAWMSEDYFIRNYIRISSFWGIIPKTAKRSWHQKLFGIFSNGDAYGVFLIHSLLKVENFRSTFRQSMCDQIVAWLDDPNPKYPFPLSARQRQSIDTEYARLDFKRGYPRLA
jgi:hypothetical protein